jgi:hypothetical protein
VKRPIFIRTICEPKRNVSILLFAKGSCSTGWWICSASTIYIEIVYIDFKMVSLYSAKKQVCPTDSASFDEELSLESSLKTIQFESLQPFRVENFKAEYARYCVEQKTPWTFLSMALVFMLYLIMESIAAASRSSFCWEKQFAALSFTLIMLCFISWCLLLIFDRVSWFISRSTLQFLFIVCMQICFLLKIVKYFFLDALPSKAVHSEHSGSFLDVFSVPAETFFFISFASSFLNLFLIESKVYSYLGFNILPFFVYIFAIAFMNHSLSAIIPLVIGEVLFLCLFLHFHRERRRAFKMLLQIQSLLNKQDESKVETRSMLGNTAHDLKTVRNVVFNFILSVFISFLSFSHSPPSPMDSILSTTSS